MRRVVSMAVAVALVAGACGDDSESASDDDTEFAAFCETDEELSGLADEAFGEVDFSDSDAVAAAFADFFSRDDVLELVDEFEAEAPEEIADEVADNVEQLQSIATTGDASVFEDPAFLATEEAIDTWVDENCDREPQSQTFGPLADLTDDQRAAATEIEVEGVEYDYRGVPAEVAAGPVVITLANPGVEDHEMGIVKVAEGYTAEQVIELVTADQDSEEGQEAFIGGGYVEVGADPVEIATVLEPGTYAFACFIESPDGEPHVAKGMSGSFTVS